MELTHFDSSGNARMVDVSEKNITHRVAIACGKILIGKLAFDALTHSTVKKGDVLTVATTAGVMGIKKNSELIPMCHNISITHASITWDVNDCALPDGRYEIACMSKVECDGKTGVEMEALTGVSIALLTVYDMLKAIDKKMIIKDIYLKEKDGGKSGHIENIV